jgi:hypothetical protein
MNKRILLLEYDAGFANTANELGSKFLIESKISKDEELSKNGVPMVIFAVLQKYGILNENNRIYSEELLKREAKKYLEIMIPQKNTLLEANHPESTQINILNGAGLMTDIWWEGITLLGKIKLNLSKGFIDSGIVSTSGDHIANMIMNDIMVGVSSRGVGSLKKINGVNYVQDDYDLLCWDFVNKPSSKGSWTGENLQKLKPFIESKSVGPEYNEKTALKQDLFDYLSKYR